MISNPDPGFFFCFFFLAVMTLQTVTQAVCSLCVFMIIFFSLPCTNSCLDVN